MKNMKLHQNRIGNRHPEHLNMHQIGPGDLAISEWQQAGLTLPNLDRMHQYRFKPYMCSTEATRISWNIVI